MLYLQLKPNDAERPGMEPMITDSTLHQPALQEVCQLEGSAHYSTVLLVILSHNSVLRMHSEHCHVLSYA